MSQAIRPLCSSCPQSTKLYPANASKLGSDQDSMVAPTHSRVFFSHEADLGFSPPTVVFISSRKAGEKAFLSLTAFCLDLNLQEEERGLLLPKSARDCGSLPPTGRLGATFGAGAGARTGGSGALADFFNIFASDRPT
ncbi:hypothetical protein M5K25_021083 [Dendrobium thyrsiflorum]|uniref:Uncharacterized protein n=1 Tax=Dendrobium thyrsiflorum TaxID=117978 RepID=A0ABD0UBH0_DENTH